MDPASILDCRLLLITGKGGVGKSAVAAAIALAAAGSGRRTCLVEVEGRQTFSQMLSTQAWDFTEREYRPRLHGLSIDPEASLREYLAMFYGARALSRLVVRSSAVEFATTAAPGIKDVLLIGKVKEMERRRDEDGHFHYDLVIVDAPPTGRIVNFLRAPDATTELVPVGPVRAQAQSLIDMLLDAERTNVVLVTLLEEMPVTETLEGAQAMRELGVALGPVVVNRVLSDPFEGPERKAVETDLDAAQLRGLLVDAGLDLSTEAAADLLGLGTAHLARLAVQQESREWLTKRLKLPQVELPEIHSDAFGEAEVLVLAQVVAEVADL